MLPLVLVLVGGAGILVLWSRGGPVWPGGRPWQAPWGGMIGPGMMGGSSWSDYAKPSYASNGERIYYTGVSARTGPIPLSGGPMWMGMRGGGCVGCHGVRGQGGVPVMMGGAIPPDIRYEALIREAHGAREEHGASEQAQGHPPYTDALIKRAINQGLDPAGRPLDWTMPRWAMGAQDLDDLVAHLKTLK